MKLSREDVVYKISKATNTPQVAIDPIITALLAIIIAETSANNEIVFKGFGTFRLKHMNERTGRNLHTGEDIPIPRKVVPSFRAGKTFRKSVSRIQEAKEKPNAKENNNPAR